MNPSGADEAETLGAYLRDARRAVGLSLRAVEQRTENVSNGYLSQIENNDIKRPSPNVLFQLAELYGIDYSNLLQRAGHKVPKDQLSEAGSAVPLRALEGLTDAEIAEVNQFIAWMRVRRSQGS